MTEAVSGVDRAPFIADVLRAFVAGFNTNSLDEVMSSLPTTRCIEPGDGREFRGREAIRKAFRPQFSGAFGAMRFIVDDRLIDEARAQSRDSLGLPARLRDREPPVRRLLFTALYGAKAGLVRHRHFPLRRAGKIVGKFSYANYGRPQLRRDLG